MQPCRLAACVNVVPAVESHFTWQGDVCAEPEELLVLADWLLTDYIGGENYLEACHALAMRKRLAGVERRVEDHVLEQWIREGHL